MSTDGKYRHIVRAVMESPWAIELQMLAVIQEIVVMRVNGERFTDEEIAARVGAKPSRRTSMQNGATAIIPIYGTIVPRADQFTSMSGGTPMQRFQSDLAAAVKDPDVANILLDIDSPGGQTDLVAEAAADIRSARRVKPVVAIANTKAASAAYWLGSQASEFVASPSAQVGSIGVFAAHDDISEAMKMKGVNTTLVSAGKYKTETSPFGPLTDEAKAHIQSRVDDQMAMFTSDVSKGRRVAVDTVRGGFGEGRMLTAKQALKEGMIDGIESIDQTLARLAAGGGLAQQEPDDAADDEPVIVPLGQTSSTTNHTGTTTAAEFAPVSFAAALRLTLGRVEQHVETALSFADVREKDRLTGPKREQFRALADALGEFGTARDAILALLADTDPERPHREALATVAAHSARLARDRGVTA